MEEMTKDTKAVQDAPASGRSRRKEEIQPAQEQKGKRNGWKILIAVVVVAAIVAGCMAGAAKRPTPSSAAAIWWRRPPGRI